MPACYADGCEAVLTSDKSFCREHWFALPNRIRRKLWAVEGKRKHRDSKYNLILLEAVVLLREGRHDPRYR
jgi:hypothetical protein